MRFFFLISSSPAGQDTFFFQALYIITFLVKRFSEEEIYESNSEWKKIFKKISVRGGASKISTSYSRNSWAEVPSDLYFILLKIQVLPHKPWGGLKRWKCFMVVCPVALEDARFIRRKPGLKCIKQKDIPDRAAWKDLSHALTFIHLVEYIIPDLFKQQAQSSLGPFVRLCERCSCPKPDSLGDLREPRGVGVVSDLLQCLIYWQK